MVVLRPAITSWVDPVLSDMGQPQLPRVALCSNFAGLDGGAFLAQGSPLDAWRLALQYGTADAVLVGSRTVAQEGLGSVDRPGYRWQPYEPLAWPQLRESGAALLEMIAATRKRWQSLGVLSSRRWPAQIVVSESGHPGAIDWLRAEIFRASHPDGSAIETHVLTSTEGATHVRRRLREQGLEHRVRVLEVSLPAQPERLDLGQVPELLNRTLDIRIVNHDGGRTLHRACVRAGVLAQLQLTLMRGASVRELVAMTPEDDALRGRWGAEFETRAQRYFSDPQGWATQVRPLQILEDARDTVVVGLDTRALRDL
jgi:riboflavin biosynthesis pyrimidine reductase